MAAMAVHVLLVSQVVVKRRLLAVLSWVLLIVVCRVVGVRVVSVYCSFYSLQYVVYLVFFFSGMVVVVGVVGSVGCGCCCRRRCGFRPRWSWSRSRRWVELSV